jgi:hypothetical protein
MRRRGALAALALLALALGAASCKPSSLTPFGIGTREPDAPGAGVNGAWTGTTTASSEISFQVASDTVVGLAIRDPAGGFCVATFDLSSVTTPVEGDAFALAVPLTPQGQLSVEGRFTSSTTCSGSYTFGGLSTSGSCPTSGSATFVAVKSL